MLLPILGTSWVFGVLAVNGCAVVFQYMFATLNSLQVRAHREWQRGGATSCQEQACRELGLEGGLPSPPTSGACNAGHPQSLRTLRKQGLQDPDPFRVGLPVLLAGICSWHVLAGNGGTVRQSACGSSGKRVRQRGGQGGPQVLPSV